MWGAMKPLANIKRTKVYGCYLIGLSTGELKKRNKKENRKGTKKLESSSSSGKLFSL